MAMNLKPAQEKKRRNIFLCGQVSRWETFFFQPYPDSIIMQGNDEVLLEKCLSVKREGGKFVEERKNYRSFWARKQKITDYRICFTRRNQTICWYCRCIRSYTISDGEAEGSIITQALPPEFYKHKPNHLGCRKNENKIEDTFFYFPRWWSRFYI